METEPLAPYYDPTNITHCKAFQDAKRKLRFVLSSAANIPSNLTSKYTSAPMPAATLNVNNLGGSNNQERT